MVHVEAKFRLPRVPTAADAAPVLGEGAAADLPCRRQSGWGPRLLTVRTGHPHSTISKVLRRNGLSPRSRRARSSWATKTPKSGSLGPGYICETRRIRTAALKKPRRPEHHSFVRRKRELTLEEIESLYRERLAAFRRVARGIVGDDEGARDAVQEAFALAVRNRKRFRGEGSLEGWIWRTVVNSARMQRRAEAARPTAPLVDHDPASNGHPPIDARVRAAVAALPERQRLVLFLHYFADLGYATIADVLEISPGTVAATLNSARASLRRVLEGVPR